MQVSEKKCFIEDLVSISVADHAVYRPLVFSASNPAQWHALQSLCATGRVVRFVDALGPQLRGLAGIRFPEGPLQEPAYQAWCDALLQGASPRNWGNYVFYPWTGTLVQLLPEALFRELRLNRNQNKITAAEQAVLSRQTVGLVGLSVGNAMALTMAMEGCFGAVKLADFDTLELSNMNRIRASVTDLGCAKTVLAARQIAEQDPYLQVSCFHEGIHDHNLAEFFDSPRLDVLVEECDDMALKVRLRHEAKARRIPVIMESSDRGVLDIERFDLEPDRPIFHGLVKEEAPVAARDPFARMDLALQINRIQDVSPRMLASILEIGDTLTTWPQLAADVVAGGGHVCHAVRAVALGWVQGSGRWILDGLGALQQAPLLTGPAEACTKPGPDCAVEQATPEGMNPRLHALLDAARLAPSGGNSQPWRFHVDEDGFWVRAEHAGVVQALDFDRGPTWMAHGAAVENAAIQAAAFGGRLTVSPFPFPDQPDVSARCTWSAEPDRSGLPQLAGALGARLTSRQGPPGGEAPPFPLERLRDLFPQNLSLQCWQDPAARTRMGELLAVGERIRCLHPELHRDLFHEIYRDNGAFSHRRTGIEYGELDLAPAQALAVRLLERPEVVAEVRAVNGARGLCAGFAAPIAASPALISLHLDRDRPGDWFELGRQVQRCWLSLHQNGWLVQPIGTTLFLLRLAKHRPELGFNHHEIHELERVSAALRGEFNLNTDRAVFLMRCFPGQPSPRRSRRKSLAELVRLGSPVPVSDQPAR
ncbi:Rv1355c family protein [Acanthopleuribacter pedis]|uniref:Rv1355c family protein n=1 Tax=Acanthopleuribacter pedis TaxID=442870 RepID=A0A8J7Q493_9BACT|nr:Rv1355c family protein [Acanthopleuribacter pedis]MBO1317431.1 Rv1355c family protein [Acanthopleuribacter pedis]